ncbi:MAG: hypothetical protein OXJ52_05605 [Oligoflexia bacterium]|nr:hypothetical protein [Oligoflexia bacterium]
MLKIKKINSASLNKFYDRIRRHHQKYLKNHDVKLPKLKNNKGFYMKDALILIYLSQGYPLTKKATKQELTQFIRKYYPNTNDVQQARHLGAQKGWWILAGGRDNIVLSLKRGEYQLYTLEKPYPGFTEGRRQVKSFDWNDIKKNYSYRCATCGSKEGEPHFHWPQTITKLQQAHKNPEQTLNKRNIIPQCQKCNRADRNRWIYDDKGRAIKLANANVLKSCSESVQKKAYRILYEKYNGKAPNQLEQK